MNAKTLAAIKRFRDEVYANAEAIDPNQNHDWHDLALGFLLACGIPRDELSWGLLSNLSCGQFDSYLEPTSPTPEEWVKTVFANNPEVMAVRLGYGWKEGLDHPIAWMDFVIDTGEHLASSQDRPLITTPDSVIRWVRDNVPLGEFRDHARPVDP